MAKINLKKTRWYKYFYEIEREFELTAQQTKIFGYIFNHCQSMNDNGYIGYSDEHMAEKLNMTYERFRKELYVLRKKELIIIKNPGKRTKRTGQSRMIYINTSVFLEDEQMSLTDIELENLKRENEKLREKLKELEGLKLNSEEHFENAFTIRIARSGVIPENKIKDMHRVLAPVYRAMSNEYAYDQITNHIDYVINQIKQRDIAKPIAYLSKAADEYKHKPDSSRLEGTIFDPNFGSNNDED